MQVTTSQQGNITTITLHGGFDALTAPIFTHATEELIQAGHHHLIIDLSHVDYVGSAGVRALLKVMKDTRQQGGEIAIASVTGEIKQVFEMTGLPSIIKFYATSDEAMASFGN